MAVDAMFRCPSACFTIAKWTLPAIERESERVLEAMRMPPIRWKASALCDGLEHSGRMARGESVRPSGW
jgi:hypothetical protein